MEMGIRIFWTGMLLSSSYILIYAQGIAFDVVGVKTHPLRPAGFLVTLDSSENAVTLSDIHDRYKSSWVAKYISVEVSSPCGGEGKVAYSANDTLTEKQRQILYTADTSCLVDIKVDYIPRNNLNYNPPRKMQFSLRVVPIYQARFEGGETALRSYLKKNVIDEISTDQLENIQITRVQFTVSAEGQISNINLLKPSGFASVDQMIAGVLSQMPKWIPARDVEGAAIHQEFELTLGSDLLRCDYLY